MCQVGLFLREISQLLKIHPPPSFRSHLSLLPMSVFSRLRYKTKTVHGTVMAKVLKCIPRFRIVYIDTTAFLFMVDNTRSKGNLGSQSLMCLSRPRGSFSANVCPIFIAFLQADEQSTINRSLPTYTTIHQRKTLGTSESMQRFFFAN